eukprot:6528533-Prymnesium_polylepis.1
MVQCLFLANGLAPAYCATRVPRGGSHFDSSHPSQTDSLQALRAIYLATNGQYWSNNSGWQSTEPACTWYGVTCNGMTIERLVLGPEGHHGFQGNNMSGTLPVELGELSSLNTLKLFDSPLLFGTVPTEIGLLTSLTELRVGNYPTELNSGSIIGRLSGTLPTQLGKLTSLKVWQFQDCSMSGTLPNELG